MASRQELANPPCMSTRRGYFFVSSKLGGKATKLWMRRPSRPLNQKSRRGRQSIEAALAVLNAVRKSRFAVAGSIRTISRGFTALSQLANRIADEARDGISRPV